MSQLKALIFDVDGTLAETEELHRRAFNETFAAASLPWDWDQAMYAELLEVTGGKERIRFYITQHDAGAALDDRAIAALHEDKTKRYTRMVADGRLLLRPGVERLLGEAQDAKVRLAIATTTSRANVDALLQATLESQPFEVIAAGDEVARKKPAPDVYLLALNKLGLPPADCLALEDTRNGVISATAAGLSCVVTVSAYGGLGPFPGAVAVVDHLGEVSGKVSGEVSGEARVLAGPALSGRIVGLADLIAWHTHGRLDASRTAG